jgi:hypothetical protein
MASQWMLWTVNPEWIKDENYHWEAFKKLTHLPFLDGENIYHSPFVLEYWSMKHGLTTIADLFRDGKKGEDPAMTYMRRYIDHKDATSTLYSPSTETLQKFAGEVLDCYSRLITFDFPRKKAACKAFSNELQSKCDRIRLADIKNKGKMSDEYIKKLELIGCSNKFRLYATPENAPQQFGFNVIPLDVTTKKLKVIFKGCGNKETDGYAYRLVCTDDEGNATYSDAKFDFDGDIGLNVPKSATHAYIVVVGYPKDKYNPMTFNPYEKDKTPKNRSFPYVIVQK